MEKANRGNSQRSVERWYSQVKFQLLLLYLPVISQELTSYSAGNAIILRTMNNQLLTTLMLAGAFLLLFAAAEAMFHLLRIRAELTRKTVHFGTGILTLLFPL